MVNTSLSNDKLEPDIEFDTVATFDKAELDALVYAASLACSAPIALISLVDDNRQWFKTSIGLPDIKELPRDNTFFTVTTIQDEVLEIVDTHNDARFIDNSLVRAFPHIRFFAGVPLYLSDGTRVGTLCVMDNKVRHLKANHHLTLVQLAKVAVSVLETHKALRIEQLSLENEHQLRTTLQDSEARFRNLSETSPIGLFITDVEGNCTYTNKRWQKKFGLDFQESLGTGWQSGIHPDDREKVYRSWLLNASTKLEFQSDFRTQHKDGTVRFVRSQATPTLDDKGQILGFIGTVRDITESLIQENKLKNKTRLLDETGMMAGVGAWEVDLTDKSIFWSEETCRIHGVPSGYQPTLDEAINYYAPEARPIIQAKLEHSIATGESWNLELPFIQADGTPIWVRAMGTAVLVKGKAIRLVGAFQNITEYKNLVATLELQKINLEDTNLRLSRAVEAGNVGIWDWDVQKNNLLWDEQMYRIYGLTKSAEDNTVSLWQNALYPEDIEHGTLALNKALSNEKEYDIEFRIVRPNGSIRYIKGNAVVTRDAQGEPLRMLGTNLDVTENREAENVIRELERRNAALLDYSPVCHKVIDLDFKLRYMNVNGFNMLSLPINNDWYGKSYPFEFFSEDSKLLMIENLCLVKTTCVRRAFESIAHDYNGNEVWLYHTIIPILKQSSEELDYLTVVSADITEQKNVFEQLKHREKMDAVGQLAGGVAHDFNNQLASIMGYAQILEQKIVDPKCKEYAAKINTAAERSSSLTKQMLNFSRKQKLKVEPTDIHHEITETLDLLTHSIDKRIQITINLNASRHYVKGEKALINNAILNLSLNACSAMEDGGSLTFITENVYPKNDVYLSRENNFKSDQHIKITIRDNGHGISKENLPKIFEPFFTTKAIGMGTGMGLASVYGTVKQHNGFIFVDSELGQGTSFSIYLPIIEQQDIEVRSATEEHNQPVPRSKAKHILVVDDEEPLRELFQDALASNGYKVTLASNGLEAVNQYRTNWQSVDLILLDMAMPVMNGGDAYKEFKKINPDVKVIISSGYDSTSATTDLVADGVVKFIGKPFSLTDLLSKVAEVLKE